MPSADSDAPADARGARRGPASSAVDEAIDRAGGAIGFDEYLDLALYGPDGFYTGPDAGGAGRRGDFLTSPEVGPLFGAVVARFLDAEWERLGQPDPFVVVDAGAGPGTLARAVLASAPACARQGALRYVTVEPSEPQRARHPDGVTAVAGLADVAGLAAADGVAGVDEADGADARGVVGVVLANELLDNLPFRLAVFDGAWREAFVVHGGDGGVAEVLSAPFDPVPPVLPARAPHGARAPLQERATAWVTEACSLLTEGRVVVFDYASPTTAGLAIRPYREWLRTYRGHDRGEHPLSAPGSQDVTCEVALDQLPTPDAARTQSQWLQRWGIDELVDEGKRVWAEQAARPGLDAMRMRSRVSESEALLDPAGLGAFTVAEWQVGSSG